MDTFVGAELITAAEHSQIAQLYDPMADRIPGRGQQASDDFVQSWLCNRLRQTEQMREARTSLAVELAELHVRRRDTNKTMVKGHAGGISTSGPNSASIARSAAITVTPVMKSLAISSASTRLSARSAGIHRHFGVPGGWCGPTTAMAGLENGRAGGGHVQQQNELPYTSPSSATLPVQS